MSSTSSTTTYTLGSQVRISGAFRTVAGVATDPTLVLLHVLRPDGVETAYTYGSGGVVAKSATGEYYALVALDKAGAWAWRWAGTGALIAAAEGTISVSASRFRHP